MAPFHPHLGTEHVSADTRRSWQPANYRVTHWGTFGGNSQSSTTMNFGAGRARPAEGSGPRPRPTWEDSPARRKEMHRAWGVTPERQLAGIRPLRRIPTMPALQKPEFHGSQMSGRVVPTLRTNCPSCAWCATKDASPGESLDPDQVCIVPCHPQEDARTGRASPLTGDQFRAGCHPLWDAGC